jgi:hypothetical protein
LKLRDLTGGAEISQNFSETGNGARTFLSAAAANLRAGSEKTREFTYDIAADNYVRARFAENQNLAPLRTFSLADNIATTLAFIASSLFPLKLLIAKRLHCS